MSPGHEAYDAEFAAIAHGLVHLVQQVEEGQDFPIFTDSHAATKRIVDDALGPGQEVAVKAIRLARRLETQRNTLTVRWVLAHQGVD